MNQDRKTLRPTWSEGCMLVTIMGIVWAMSGSVDKTDVARGKTDALRGGGKGKSKKKGRKTSRK